MEEGKAVVHVPVVPQVAEASCRQAAEDCPADAITVEP
jgi:ferredoxin